MMRWTSLLNNLLNGDYENSWLSHNDIIVGSAAYGEVKAPNYNKPIWNGVPAPITLLVDAQFGYGDTIQFYRFIAEAKKRVAKLILRCDNDFKELFCDTETISKEELLPEFDQVIHMMALPYALGTKGSFNGKPYLSPNMNYLPDSTLQALLLVKFFKVGVCWAGNPFNPEDRNRSVKAELFEHLKFTSKLPLFSLNNFYDPPNFMLDMRCYMRNWNDTAHYVKMLDLVITVDTAVAHLAGAMGVPVWLMARSENPEWRWGLEGCESKWYDSMRIYRKKTTWDDLIETMKQDLIKMFEKDNGGLVCGV